jgi:predicted transcriptional regulator
LSSPETIRKLLHDFGITVREKSHHNGNPAQSRYGQKIFQGKLVDHKSELRTVKTIFKMKQEGLGLRAIARCLNEMKIPTKCRGKSWHPQMVKRILEANERDFRRLSL